MKKDKKKFQAQAPPKSKPSPQARKPEAGFRSLLPLLIILPVTFIAFSPSLENEFTNWDDPSLIIDNPFIKELSWENIRKIFTEIYFGNYQPLHLVSYAIEHHFWQLDPKGYHAVSLVMHLINVALVFFFIRLLSGNIWIAAITSALFAVSPMRVESVAWAAERKDLLYSMFFFAALIFYWKYIREGEKTKMLIFCFLLFVFSVFSKTMAVSLVPVLFLLDFFYKRKFTGKLIIEKIPFFILAIVMGSVSVYAVDTSETMDMMPHFPLIDRIFFGCHNLLLYVAKSIVPFSLSGYYPYPDEDAAMLPLKYYVSAAVVVFLAAAIIYSLKKGRKLFFSAGFFVSAVFLVLMIIPVGPTIFSERYSYIPSVGLFYFLSAGALELIEKSKTRKQLKRIAIAFTAAVLVLFSSATYSRCKVWKNSLTMWSDVIEKYPGCDMARNNRGNHYGKVMGRLDEARADYDVAIAANPEFYRAWSNRGIVNAMQNKDSAALHDFEKALAIKPNFIEALANRAILYSKTGRYEIAVQEFSKVIEIEKGVNAINFNYRGLALVELNRLDEAMKDLEKAISLNPNIPDVYYRKSLIYYKQANYPAALVEYEKAKSFRYDPNPDLYNFLKSNNR